MFICMQVLRWISSFSFSKQKYDFTAKWTALAKLQLLIFLREVNNTSEIAVTYLFNINYIYDLALITVSKYIICSRRLFQY